MKELEKKSVRTFSVAFKQEKVKEIENKQITVSQLSRIYKVTRSAVYKWIRLYGNMKIKGERIVVEKESEALKTEKLMKKVSELEQLLGQKQVEVEYLKKVIDFSGEAINMDLKKKFESK